MGCGGANANPPTKTEEKICETSMGHAAENSGEEGKLRTPHTTTKQSDQPDIHIRCSGYAVCSVLQAPRKLQGTLYLEDIETNVLQLGGGEAEALESLDLQLLTISWLKTSAPMDVDGPIRPPPPKQKKKKKKKKNIKTF